MASAGTNTTSSYKAEPSIRKHGSVNDVPTEELGQSVTIDTNGQDLIENGTITALGYQPAYRRVLGAFAGFCVVLSLTSPLGAILVSGHYPIYYAGYWGLSWGWILPNLMMLPQVLAICELCSSMPVNAGSYWWAAALAPARFSRPVAFITGWFNILALSTALAAFSFAVASGLAQNIMTFTDGLVLGNAHIMGFAMATITIWAVLMLLRLENVSILMMVTGTFLAVSSVAVIIALPVVHSQAGLPFAAARDVFGSYKNYSPWSEAGIAVPISFYGALFVNSVWTAPAYVAEETHNARVETPRAMLNSYIVTAVVGWGICLAFAFCISDMDTLVRTNIDFPLFEVVFRAWGKSTAAPFLLIGAIFSLVGSSGMLLTYATQVAAFARDEGLPYSKELCSIHERTNMPLNAVALLVGLSYLFLLPALSTNASDIIYAMATMCSMIILCIPLLLRLFAGDRWIPGPFNLGRWSKPAHFLGVLFSLFFFITRCFPPDPETPPAQAIVLVAVVTVAIGSWFIRGKNFKGLDLGALEAWRYAAHHTGAGSD
ncbi:hypothetical protein CkaCkLH20_00313 [Colletotrichum karsti]|uniref:Amino acid transporter n=1 Tax=Colletotrichum karsti TaxID=1095194 RepID=A0A9P6IGT8_9PEZI|nr:uncharacterized protein CkaCkLH20_00313 [Colletotrichum karsti]KAF9882277.1 hypothetical protein CkaCkLH20_00313 [Colletotrichum karsti]